MVSISAKPKPKPVTKLAPEYPSSTPRRSSRQGPKRTGSGEVVSSSQKASLPPVYSAIVYIKGALCGNGVPESGVFAIKCNKTPIMGPHFSQKRNSG